MRSRRWIVALVAGVALFLVAGRVVSGWYVDYQWYASLGAAALWRAKAADLLLLRGGTFLVGSAFVFANLYAVRFSIESLVLPRRVGNLEFGEEVSGRILLGVVLILSAVIGALMAFAHDDWLSVELIRHGLRFGETDPYFQFDLGYWLYRLPLESALHVWSLIGLVAVTLVVIFLYALTPSLRWEGGHLHVSTYVRRHLFTLGAVLLLLLAWSYRLDAYGLLHSGSGPLGAFSAIDHRVGIPANLLLAVAAVAAGMLVAWSGWTGHIRVAFVTLTVMLLAALTVRQIVPPIAERFVSPADPEARERPYREIRSGYTRRAYDVDRLTRGGPPDERPSFADAARGAPLWDGAALARAIGRPREAAKPVGAVGWDEQEGRVVGFVVEQPTGPGSVEAGADWGIARVAADVTDDRGAPLPRDDPDALEARGLGGVLVHDSATSYYLVSDSGGHVAAPELRTFGMRLALAWHLQNPRLLGRRGEDGGSVSTKVVLHRDVRDRLHTLYPFFAQATQMAPLVWRDSLFWVVHLYSTSEWYPLSQEMPLGDRQVRYLRHAAVAIVNAHTGSVAAVGDDAPDPLTATWMQRFPRLFVDAGALDPDLTRRLPPPVDATLVGTLAFAQVGVRGEFEPPSHLPRRGGDTLFTTLSAAPYYDQKTGALTVAMPLLDPADRLRGVMAGSGGARPRVRWQPLAPEGPTWPNLVERLQRLDDSLRAGMRSTRPLHGAVRIVPTADGFMAIETHYLTRPDGTPTVWYVSLFHRDSVLVGTSIMGAARLPLPTVPHTPLTPDEFRRRIDSYYEAMREALRRGDWTAFGMAYEALGRLLRAAK